MPTLAVRLTPGIEAAALEPSSICAFEVHRELWVSQIEVAYYDALHSPPIGLNLAAEFSRNSPFLRTVGGWFPLQVCRRCRVGQRFANIECCHSAALPNVGVNHHK